MKCKIVFFDEPQDSLFNQVFMKNQIHDDLDLEKVKAIKKAGNCFEEIFNIDIDESNLDEKDNANYNQNAFPGDENEQFFHKKKKNLEKKREKNRLKQKKKREKRDLS